MSKGIIMVSAQCLPHLFFWNLIENNIETPIPARSTLMNMFDILHQDIYLGKKDFRHDCAYHKPEAGVS